jgi:hypothetical protein
VYPDGVLAGEVVDGAGFFAGGGTEVAAGAEVVAAAGGAT